VLYNFAYFGILSFSSTSKARTAFADCGILSFSSATKSLGWRQQYFIIFLKILSEIIFQNALGF
jgi:hypothetical protein